MGVKITELLPKKEAEIEDLHGKTIAIDASLFLYQFLTSIRQRDGSLLTDSNGNVTSHLVGLFSRTAKLIQWGIKPVYVFDGKPPELKSAERERRSTLKKEAQAKYEIAVEKEDIDEMKKYASRTTRLTKEMVAEAKELLEAMGIPIVQAPSEGEAQASYMVKKGDAYAIASQDSDSLMFGAPRLLRNLSAYGKRKVANKLSFETVSLELIELKEVLHELDITQDQFVALCMLVGTDYNYGGIKGIGPKNALKIVKKHKKLSDIFEEAKWGEHFEFSWKEVYDTIKDMKTTDEYDLKSSSPDEAKVNEILVERHQFSDERVEKTLETIRSNVKKRAQMKLGEF